MKNKRNFFRNISFIIALLFIGAIFYNNINVNATDKTPYLRVDFSASPNPAIVGEDININCTITPQPFEVSRAEKEIVLVLDVSGSMNDVIEVEYCPEPSFFGYCVTHFPQRAGHVLSSKTKIQALKDAARGFVDKMKTVDNLKIGIVAFSSYGIINPREATTSIVGRSYGDNFYQTYGYNLISSSDVATLNNIINNLGAEGGTNTGDGLRNAAYLLNKSSSTANKTIVLMSDGLPTFSSHISSKNSNPFVDITKATGGYPNDTGNGAADNGDSNYAKTIGGIIKQKGYNVYSIGYGLGSSNSTSNVLLKSIHESMGGTNGTFFADDSGSIDAIFNSIAGKIIDSYEVKDIEINLNLGEDFQLAIGGNKITIPEDRKIVYRKAASSTSTVTRYEADPVQFTFKIKANKESTNTAGTSFGIGTITYKDWYGREESVALNPINIKVNPLSNIPNVRASLLGASPNPAYPGEEVEVTYKITPEEFTSKVMNTENKPYSSVYAKLNFDLNNNFQYVNNSISNNVTNVALSGEKLVLQLHPINYAYAGRTADNNYRYTASEMTISFRVKSRSGINGELSFANNPTEVENLKNFLSHNMFSGSESRKTIDTPRITIGSSNIQHGIYEGIKNNSPIYTGTPRVFAKGALVSMAALFNTIRNETNISLTVSPQLKVKDGIKLYKVSANGELQLIANMTINGGVYSYKLTSNPGAKILALYSVTLPDAAGTYTNTIYVGTENKDAIVKVNDDSLPDLF